MANPRKTKYFIVQHGLDDFTLLPGFIWRTGMGPRQVPHRFKEVGLGDRWIAFAYTTNDNRDQRLSLITGFYECTQTACYQKIPLKAVAFCGGTKNAWMIKGTECGGRQPKFPVGVPPIADLLGKPVWTKQALVPIDAGGFDRIREYTLRHEFSPARITPLGREPENEQEVLAIVIHDHKKLGIEKIIRVGKAFPDLLVKLEGHREAVHLELEVYSKGFFSHGHDKQVKNLCVGKEKRPVAVLCWIDNDKHRRVR